MTIHQYACWKENMAHVLV